MKTWDDWSDLEINCSVAIALGCDVVIEFAPSSTSVYCGYEGLESTQDERDYCNNSADMWPIILQNDISIINKKGFYYATTNCYETFEPHGLGVADGYFYSKAQNESGLLRAAAVNSGQFCATSITELRLSRRYSSYVFPLCSNFDPCNAMVPFSASLSAETLMFECCFPSRLAISRVLMVNCVAAISCFILD
jgi:hypothetical protein